MLDWILQRAKAVMGFAIPAVTGAIIKSVEQGFGFDIPADVELGIIAFLTGLFVHQTPNKSA